MNYFTKKLLPCCLLAALMLTGCDKDKFKFMNQKIAYINLVQVLKESSVDEQEAEHVRAVYDVLHKASQDVQTVYKTLSESEEEKNKKQQTDTVLLNRTWKQEQLNARTESLKVVSRAAEEYRKNHNLDMIISSEQVVAAEHSKDVTQEVIALLKDVTVTYGAVPEVTIDNGKPEQKGAENNVSQLKH